MAGAAAAAAGAAAAAAAAAAASSSSRSRSTSSSQQQPAAASSSQQQPAAASQQQQGHGFLFFLSSSFTPPALFSFFSRDSLHVTFAVALPAAYGIFFGSGCLRLLGVRACGLHLHDGRLLCRGPGPSCTERWKSYSPLLVLAEDFGGLPTGTHMAVMAITAEGWAQAQRHPFEAM